jgi:hypothetical protein
VEDGSIQPLGILVAGSWTILVLSAPACAQSPVVLPPPQTRESPAGEERVIEGPVAISKGLPFVGGYFVPLDAVEARLGRGWSSWLPGKRVRVRGVTEIYVCGPAEQCLIEGRITRFRSVTDFAPLDPAACADGAPPRQAAPCPANNVWEALHCPARDCPVGTVWDGRRCTPSCTTVDGG